MTTFFRFIVFSQILLVPALAVAQKAVGCEKADKSEKTSWGWIMEDHPTEGGVVNRLVGRVQLPDESVLAGALVEVFDHPELEVEKRTRLAACRTGENGMFQFKGLSPGRYEIRASYSRGGLNAGQTMVTLAPTYKTASGKEITVQLEISN